MKGTWTPERIETLKQSYLLFSNAEIAKRIGLTTLAVKSKARVLGLSKRRFWTQEEIDYVKANYENQKTAVIAFHLNRSISAVFGIVEKLGIEKSEQFRKSPLSGRLRPGSQIGGATRFRKGQSPVNKGKKQQEYMSKEGIERSRSTRFKKGQQPKNTKHDGAISIRKNYKRGTSYYYKRIGLGRWRELHRIIWEEQHGPIPTGYNVQFKDRNTLNCTIENLYLIKRKDQMMDNTIQRYPAEVRTTMQALGKFKSKIKKYEEQN